MKFTMTDERPVLGATFTVDPQAFDHMCEVVGLVTDDEVEIHLVPVEDGDNPGGIIFDPEEEDVPHRVALAVSDRPEFSESAVRRLNRNLAHELRHLAQFRKLTETFDRTVGLLVLLSSQRALCSVDALMAERKVRDDEAAWALKPVVDQLPEEAGLS